MNEKIEICKTNIVNHGKVKKVNQALPKNREVVELSETFKVLSDPTRLRIVLALSMEELCVCDLATIVNISISAISHQLRLLKSRKLVTYRKEGKMVYYKLDDDHVVNLITQATEHVRE
ncbi:transcriptional regulator [candidate division KSB1 bacterium 4484_87]|nr:MAG: transcriptional regulator [candidate division KSB1 bacterium 4484_87]